MPSKSKNKVIQQLLEIAQTHDDSGDTSKGNDIRTLIAEINDPGNKRDHTQIKIQARIQIDKYDGDIIEGVSVPVETSEFISEI